jgi:prepilin peptidase CpaA
MAAQRPFLYSKIAHIAYAARLAAIMLRCGKSGQSGIMELYFLIALAGLLTYAAISDLRRYVIPNWLSLAIIGLFIVYSVANPPSWRFLVFDILGTLTLFAFGLLLFARGMFGGGDLKLLCSTALWMGLADIPRFLLVTTLAGGVLALLILIFRSLKSADGRLRDHRVPYGIAIACAGFDYCLRQANLPLW